MRHRIGFIGAGRMASAMVDGLLRDDLYQPDAITCTCGGGQTGPELAARTGIRYEADWAQLMARSSVLVLACKPQHLDALNAALASWSKGKLVLSILAGIRLARLAKIFPRAENIVRTMPNTPGQIGAGVTGFAVQRPLGEEQTSLVVGILESLGTVISLNEPQLDALTAVSGSGPAYLFEFTAALRQAAESTGLPLEVADLLARQTVIGAARLMQQSEMDPVELRDSVTSPGGTTQAALASFEADALRAVVQRAVEAAKQRSIDLGASS